MTAVPFSLPRIRPRSWFQPVTVVPLKLVTTSPGWSPAWTAGVLGSPLVQSRPSSAYGITHRDTVSITGRPASGSTLLMP